MITVTAQDILADINTYAQELNSGRMCYVEGTADEDFVFEYRDRLLVVTIVNSAECTIVRQDSYVVYPEVLERSLGLLTKRYLVSHW